MKTVGHETAWVLVAAVGLAAVGCRERQPAPQPDPSVSASTAKSAAGAGAVSAASVSASAASSAAAAPPALEPWLVGKWRGKASTYADVQDGHQTYDVRQVTLDVTADGRITLAMRAGNSPGGHLEQVEASCTAEGKLGQDVQTVTLHVEASTCTAAQAGSEATVHLIRVGECVVQWNTQQGVMPYRVAQIAFRREGCK